MGIVDKTYLYQGIYVENVFIKDMILNEQL